MFEITPTLRVETEDLCVQGRLEAGAITMVPVNLPKQPGVKVVVAAWMGPYPGVEGSSCEPGRYAGSVLGDGSCDFSLPLRVCQNDWDLLKMGVWTRSLDEETLIEKTSHFASGPVELQKVLAATTEVPVEVLFSSVAEEGNFVKLKLWVDNVPRRIGELTPSRLWMTRHANAIAHKVSRNMMAAVAQHRARIPAGGDMFSGGGSVLEFGPLSNKIPPLETHYALMNFQQEACHRALPVGVYLYNLALTSLHSGLSVQDMLSARCGTFAQHAIHSLGLTTDAGAVPYERDTGLAFKPGVGLSHRATENMALPCGFPTYLARAPKLPLSSKALQSKALQSKEMQSQALQSKEMQSQALQSKALKKLGLQKEPKASSALWASVTAALALSEGRRGDRCVLSDDCETSAQLQKLMVQTVLDAKVDDPASGGQWLRAAVAGCAHFAQWTPECFEQAAGFMRRLKSDLASRRLVLATTVGAATSAAAGGGESGELNGHCFVVCKYSSGCKLGCECGTAGECCRRTHANAESVWHLSEGTSPMREIRVSESTPKVQVKLLGAGAAVSQTALCVPEFLSAFAKTVSSLSLVINQPLGGGELKESVGWALPDGKRLSGFSSSTMFVSDMYSGTPPAFYNRIMYMGVGCTEGGVGCMPLEQEEGGGLTMGCSPHRLPSLSTRAVDAGLTCGDPVGGGAPAPRLGRLVSPTATLACTLKELYHGIHQEAVVPVDHAAVVDAMSTWEPVPPLASLVGARATEGYYQVGFCECPCDPDVVPAITLAKRALLEKVTEINLARTDSDGIRLRACVPLGTGAHVALEVPHGITHLTFVESLRSAMREVAWPGRQVVL